MITKNDCMALLVKMEDQGTIDVNQYIKKLIVAKEIPIEVLRFIAKNRGLEVANFYEMLRKSYNSKKSPLYKNLVTNEEKTEEELVIILSSLLTQIGLYNKRLNKNTTFIKDVRATEISRVLVNYYESNDLEIVQKLLSLIKSDILVLEYIAGRREIA